MYVCQCKPKIKRKKDKEGVMAFRQVEVDHEGICLNCGYYAVNTKSLMGSAMRDVLDSHGCTIFTSNDMYTTFDNIKEVKVSSKLYMIRKGLSENGYFRGKKYIAVLGKVTELPEHLKFKSKELYVFKKDGSFVGFYNNKKELIEDLKISRAVLNQCLNGGHWQTKDGYIITRNKDVNISKRVENIRRFDSGDYSLYDDYDVNEGLGIERSSRFFE